MPSIKITAVAAPQNTTAVMGDEEELDLSEAMFKTIQHFVPKFFTALSRIPDPRDPTRTVYPIQEFFLVGILAFMLKTRSRRNIKYRLGTPKFIRNMQNVGGVLYPQEPFPDTLLHGDTLNKLVNRIPVKYSQELRNLILRTLIRSRCLEKWRILSSYAVVIDGTGAINYHNRHCLTAQRNRPTFTH